MGIKKHLAAFVCCMLLFSVGCSSPADKGSSSDNNQAKAQKGTDKAIIDPIKLLTKAEAEAILGEPIKEPENRDTKNPLGQRICFYAPVSDKTSGFIQLAVVQNESMSDSLKEQGYKVTELYNQTKNGLGEVTPITGLGNEAFWGTNGLHILKDNVYLNISVGNSNNPKNLELAKNIAIKVIPRL